MARTRGRPQRVLAGVAALYGLFLVTTPFEHHDLLCHLKNPQHCTACTCSVVASSPDAPLALPGSRLADAGRPPGPRLLFADFLLAVGSTGRSPPHQA